MAAARGLPPEVVERHAARAAERNRKRGEAILRNARWRLRQEVV
jgi:malonyl CoA-acyl carrier protein transacylase